jgi:hypothetical protein
LSDSIAGACDDPTRRHGIIGRDVESFLVEVEQHPAQPKALF